MVVLLLAAALCIAPTVLGGHYKIRAPPPPPAPPASVHYGQHPPPHRPSYIHPYRSPPPGYYPPPSGPHHHHHPPRTPYFHKSTPREYHHRVAGPPIYQQPKVPPSFSPPIPATIPAVSVSPYSLWNSYNAFRAPVFKETFNLLPETYTSSAPLIRDDDKGPIHTIPAPNLGGGPDAAHQHTLSSATHSAQHHHHHHHKKQDPEDDLVAVLRHGITNVNVPHSSPYQQVTEDPSIHTPEKDTPLHFAPDPDPSTPFLKVPATHDPQSIPSNGQVPLDIYLQQEVDKKVATTDASNTLTAQDLFNLLNYQPGQQPASLPAYNADSLLQNPSSQFSPQFQTFNYDERTQQGAFGSNSFPTASMSLELGSPELSANDNFLDSKVFSDNDLAGSDKDETFHKVVDPDNEIDPKRDEPKKKVPEKSTAGKNEATRAPKHPSSNDLTQSNAKFEIRVPQDIKDKIKKETSPQKEVSPCPPGTSCVLPVASPQYQIPTNVNPAQPDDIVQLQKSIQIYSTTYSTSVQDGAKYVEQPSTQKPAEKKARGIVIADQEINPQTEPANPDLPFGARIRPKRF